MLNFKSFKDSIITRSLTVVPGSTAAINGQLAQLPVEVHDYPVVNQNGLPFRDDSIPAKKNKFVAQPKPEMYEWTDVENLVQINEVKPLLEAHLSDSEISEREKVVKKLKQHSEGFEKKYGKDALNVMYAVATKIAKQHNEEVDNGAGDSNSTIAKKAHKGEDLGAPGKNFSKIANKAAKKYGSKEAGEKVAAAIMWKKLHKEEALTEAWNTSFGSYDDYLRRAQMYRQRGLHTMADRILEQAQKVANVGRSNPLVAKNIGEETITEVKTYKGYGARTDLEVNPDDATSAVILARKYDELAGKAVTAQQREEYAATAQRFFDTANRIKNETLRNLPHKKQMHKAADKVLASEEAVEVDNSLEALKMAANEPDGVDLELDTGAVITITQDTAKELLAQYQTEESVFGALVEMYMGDAQSPDSGLLHKWNQFKDMALLVDLLHDHHTLPLWDDKDADDKDHKKKIRDHIDNHIGQMSKLRKDVAKKYGEEAARDMEDQGALHVKNFGCSMPNCPLNEDWEDGDPNSGKDTGKLALLRIWNNHLQTRHMHRNVHNFLDKNDNNFTPYSLFDDQPSPVDQAEQKEKARLAKDVLNLAMMRLEGAVMRKHGSDMMNDMSDHSEALSRARNMSDRTGSEKRNLIKKADVLSKKHLGDDLSGVLR